MEKRGSLTIEQFWIIPRVILVILVIAVIVLIVNSYVGREMKTYELENSILLSSLLYSEDCLVYEDFREHPGVIDLRKFNENDIKKCGEYGERVAFKLELFDLDNNLIDELSVNSDLLDRYLPSCGAEHKTLYCNTKMQYILIGENLKPGILKMSVVRLK